MAPASQSGSSTIRAERWATLVESDETLRRAISGLKREARPDGPRADNHPAVAPSPAKAYPRPSSGPRPGHPLPC